MRTRFGTVVPSLLAACWLVPTLAAGSDEAAEEPLPYYLADRGTGVAPVDVR